MNGTSPAPNAVAVIGMAGRFPGADSVSEYWDNLRSGAESITTLTPETLRAAGIDDEVLANPAYVRRAPILRGVEEFDADFFGFSPQAARMTDPQHRLFLQTAWHALEDAGCDPAHFDGSIGVYGSSSASGYLGYNLLTHRNLDTIMGQGTNIDLIGLSFQNDKDFLATRVSYEFNLRGPSIAVQTACSSSLVAVHLACQSLLNGECDMALAGGVSIRIPHDVGYWYEPGSIVSAAGHCRPFDVRADGTVFGSGVGIVVLKPLQAALDDGDRIHAVIRGSAVNNDGSRKIGFSAPNAAAQADVIAEAHAVADVDPSTIDFVETHGTGTPLGDPIEIDALRTAFDVSESDRAKPCVLGSVKSNIGHLEVASGIAGLIKSILCLKHRAIPGTLHFTSPNPELHLDQSPFVVQTEYAAWEADSVRRAGVSSFGVGGTNAHVVVEEAPPVPARRAPAGPQVLLLSAQTAEGLTRLRTELAAQLAGPDELDLADVAFTLEGRRPERFRLAAVADDREQAAAVLTADEHDNAVLTEAIDSALPDQDSRVVFLFPGQGAQHAGMASGLYETEPVFRAAFDSCADGFRDELGIDLRAELFDGPGTNLARTDHAQPALFAVEYALAALTEAYGVRPAAYAGHSIGEYVAATCAGVFDLPTAITAVSARARLMHAAPRGAMVAVAAGPEAVGELLTDGLDLAAINDPGNCVVSGPDDLITELEDRLAEAGLPARRMRTSHGFHSSAMDPVLAEFTAVLSGLPLRAPQRRLLSNTTGTWMSDEEATDPARWARQIRATVRFSDNLDTLLADRNRVLMEVGPGGALTASAVRQPRWSAEHRAVRLMRHHLQDRHDRDAFLLGLGQLWSAGVAADWSLLRGEDARRVTLPGYPFARQTHWVQPRRGTGLPVEQGADAGSGAPADEAATSAPATREQQIEAVLHRIWSQALGIETIDRNANFFELGGDSVNAIGIATNMAKEGLELEPQDLFENQSIAALTTVLAARYAGVGLAGTAGPVAEAEHPPLPPNITGFLEKGLRETGRWCVPLVLRLDAQLTEDDVRSVLTAVTDRHEALRLRIAERAGTWEQDIAEPGGFTALTTRSLPADVAAIVTEMTTAEPTFTTPLAATYLPGAQGDPGHLVLTVHHLAGDNASREILVTDLFTAFAQRSAGQDIALPPVGTSWREWSQRCAALATHPAVLDTREYWLETAAAATLRVADHDVTEPPRAADLCRLPATLSAEATAGLDEAQRTLRFPADEILLAALGRTIAHTRGDGVAAVDLAGHGRLVLKPDVDLHRTVGWFTTIYPVALRCNTSEPQALLTGVHDALAAVPHHGIGYGLLRYVYAPTARRLAATPAAEVFFSYLGTVPSLPELDGPVQFDMDAAAPARDTLPAFGHAVELRVYRDSGVLHLDWWYDARRMDRATVEALAQHFPAALAELTTSDAAPVDDDLDNFALVDLS